MRRRRGSVIAPAVRTGAAIVALCARTCSDYSLCPLCQFRKSDSSGLAQRTKPDILDDYKQKLDESPAAAAASKPAAKCSSAFVSDAPQAMTGGSTHDFVSVGSVSSPSAAERVDASRGVEAAEEQPSSPSVSEFEAITPIAQFRKRAVELGLVVWKSSGSGSRPAAKQTS